MTPITKKSAGVRSKASSRRRLATGVKAPSRSTFDRPGGHSGDEVVYEERIEHGDWHRAKQRGGHQLAPEEFVAPDQALRDADRDRLGPRAVHEDERVEVLVPGEGEGEHARRQDARQCERNDDPDHGLQPSRPVHESRLFQLARDALEVADQEPGAERDQERRVREDERPEVVVEDQRLDELGHAQEEQRGRNEVGDENRPADPVGAREAEPGQRVAGQDAAEERDRRRDDRNDRRVERPAREESVREEVLVVLQGRLAHKDGQLVEVEHLGVALEAGDEHPVEGEERDEYEKEYRDVDPEETRQKRVPDLDPAPLLFDLAATSDCGHQSAFLSISRTTAMMIVRIGKRKREMAAPIP